MFVDLSTKINLPAGTSVRSISWATNTGWLAVGGANGFLTAFQLGRGATQPSGGNGSSSDAAIKEVTCVNHLEGHGSNVCAVHWSPAHPKLASGDDMGKVVVWGLHQDIWQEQSTITRQKGGVLHLAWSQTDTRVCILYMDGHISMATADGRRLWEAEVRPRPTCVTWDGSGSRVVIGTDMAECQLLEEGGRVASSIKLPPLAGGKEQSRLVAVDWARRAAGSTDPALVLAADDGRLYLLKDESDSSPVGVATPLRLSRACWSPQGALLALAGWTPDPAGAPRWLVQFATPAGEVLQTLKSLPSGNVQGLAWDASGHAAVIALDTCLYFCAVHHSHTWTWFGERSAPSGVSGPPSSPVAAGPSGTLVYVHTNKPVVSFWKINSLAAQYTRVTKMVTGVISLKGHASGELCLLVTSSAGASDAPYELLVCDVLGQQLASMPLQLDVADTALTSTAVLAASRAGELVVWDLGELVGMPLRGNNRRASMVAKAPVLQQTPKVDLTKVTNVPPSKTADTVRCLAASDKLLAVGWLGGAVDVFLLPHVVFVGRHMLPAGRKPYTLQFNCNSTQLAVLGSGNNLCTLQIPAGTTILPQESLPLDDLEAALTLADVWEVVWHQDDPSCLAVLGREGLQVCVGNVCGESMHPGTDISLCSFQGLTMQAGCIETIMRNPDLPTVPKQLFSLDLPPLAALKNLLKEGAAAAAAASTGMTVVSTARAQKVIQDTMRQAIQMVEGTHPADAQASQSSANHPALWRTVALEALQHMDLAVAERAFMGCKEYRGLQLIKSLRQHEGEAKRRAQIAIYHRNWAEAQKWYSQIDRQDLVVDLHLWAANHEDLEQLLAASQSTGGGLAWTQGGDARMTTLWNVLGEFYFDKHQWDKAIRYFAQSRNVERLADCFALSGDVKGLEHLVGLLPQGALFTQLTTRLAAALQLAGNCDAAVQAYLKAGQVAAAVQCCVSLQRWEVAVRLSTDPEVAAQLGSLKDSAAAWQGAVGVRAPGAAEGVEGLVRHAARQLLDAGKLVDAMRLLRQAGRHLEAAKMLLSVLKPVATAGAMQMSPIRNPLLTKQLYCLAAFEILSHGEGPQQGLQQGSLPAGLLSSCWRGAVAFHLLALAHKALYAGQHETALRAALHLTYYTDVVPQLQVYALLAVAAHMGGFMGTCSEAVLRLKHSPGFPAARKQALEQWAMTIFWEHPPIDARTLSDAQPLPRGGNAEPSVKPPPHAAVRNIINNISRC